MRGEVGNEDESKHDRCFPTRDATPPCLASAAGRATPGKQMLLLQLWIQESRCKWRNEIFSVLPIKLDEQQFKKIGHGSSVRKRL